MPITFLYEIYVELQNLQNENQFENVLNQEKCVKQQKYSDHF